MLYLFRWCSVEDFGGDIFRLLGFFDGESLVVLNHGFQKKTQKHRPKRSRLLEIVKRLFAEKTLMSDLQRYLAKRKASDPEFAENYDEGYQAFKFGVLLKEARKDAGLTQLDLANKSHTQKSAISRIENHSEDVKLSTLEKFASALGKKLEIRLV
jgi:HTH-type transcriptional regulator / antitoxin HipB